MNELHTITFELNEKELAFIDEMSKEIFECSVRSRGRSLEQVASSVRNGVILEFALQRLGAQKNPAEFDVTDRDTYAWDVLWNGKKTEVKRKKFLHNDTTKYYSWDRPEYVKTFLNNLDLVEQLIVGDFIELENNYYRVEWMLETAVDKNFRKYINKSMYNQGQMYYNHFQDTSCNYLRNTA